MKKNIIIVSCALLCTTSILLLSCNKKDKVVGEFIVKGYLYDSCGGVPQKNIPLQVSYKESASTGSSSLKDDNIGTATTDANGYFEIKCKKYTNSQEAGKMDIFNATTRYVYLDDFAFASLQRKLDVIDFGYGFTNGFVYKGSVKAKLSGSFLSTDTLFLGQFNGQYESHNNLVSGNEFTIKVSGNFLNAFQLEKYGRSQIYWGFGFNDFKSNKHIIDLGIGACGYPDTTTIKTINK
jgi:hypothetical protein